MRTFKEDSEQIEIGFRSSKLRLEKLDGWGEGNNQSAHQTAYIQLITFGKGKLINDLYSRLDGEKVKA